jgi:hypothetical protein
MDHTPPPARAIWSRLGGQLGVGLCAVGFILVFLGWNGAASVDRLPSQLPYLLSGGIAGLCFVVVGVGMLVVQNQRADRAALQSTLRELRDALAQAGLAEPDGAARPAFRKPAPRPRAALDEQTAALDGEPIEAPAAAPKPARKRTTKPRTAPLTATANSRSDR